MLARGNRPTPKAILQTISRDPAQRSGLLMIGLLMIGQFGIIPFMNPYLIENVGFREDQLPLVYLVGGLLTLISSPLIGRWADRSGHQRVFTYVALLSILPIIALTNLPRVPIWVGLLAMGTFFMGVGGRGVVAFTLVSGTAPAARRAGLMSMATMTQHLFVSLGSVLGGWLVIQITPRSPLQHFDWVGYIAVATTLGAVYCGRFVRPIANAPQDTITLHAVTPASVGILPTDLTDPTPAPATPVAPAVA
jgi:MFS transporter, DHA1 family, inner membrane transport protein